MVAYDTAVYSAFLLHVDGKLLGNELHDVGRQHLGVGSHAHRRQFIVEASAPVHQGLYGNAGTVGQL